MLLAGIVKATSIKTDQNSDLQYKSSFIQGFLLQNNGNIMQLQKLQGNKKLVCFYRLVTYLCGILVGHITENCIAMPCSNSLVCF